jgi:hypothetical protein
MEETIGAGQVPKTGLLAICLFHPEKAALGGSLARVLLHCSKINTKFLFRRAIPCEKTTHQKGDTPWNAQSAGPEAQEPVLAWALWPRPAAAMF